ncbi:hypothetical protein OPT61_g1930 [Boeremia exigua]|uniref:Uncharacterized protein n=1 Tax=Boeremia exigua TaxID=749465 RepID=A0ACC2INB6_9PLEO|nr:hypothetical protein OPT61_g1930 [Boeremia exigua]
MVRLRREDYTIGWVCALPIELAAAQEMLDDEHETPLYDAHDTNLYTCGQVGEHNVVIACLPEDQTGTHSAAAVAVQMKTTFPATRFGLMVGIGGGVPSEEADVRLGDVVVNKPSITHGGVVQYNSGKATLSGFERIGTLSAPPTVLLNAISSLRARQIRGKSRLLQYLSKLDALPNFSREAAGSDNLFETEYEHVGNGATCRKCDSSFSIAREPRKQDVVVHYGTIASGNQVIRSATERDKVSEELGGVMCFEMEAAGLMNSFPCLVVRGICDYADSHKNKRWQAYAAGTAAAYAKELLSVIPPAEVADSNTVEEMIEVADERESQLSFPKRILEQVSTIPSTVSQTHRYSDNIWSLTSKGSEVITDDTNHSTLDPMYSTRDEKQHISLSKPSMARTVYTPSATLTSPALENKGYISGLANELFEVVNSPNPTRDTLDRISQLLPGLLRAFAVKIGYQAPTSMHRDVMFEENVCYRNVQESFQRSIEYVFQAEEFVEVDEELSKDAVNRYMNDTERYDEVPEQHIEDDSTDDHGQQDDGLGNSNILDFILQTPAYRWLVATLERETTLARASPDLMENIGTQIRDMMPLHHEEISRKTSSQEYKATFELLWNPLQFIKDHQFDESTEGVLEEAITLTGTIDDAQALTTLEYLCQVWPASGVYVMQLITEVACNSPDHFADSNLPDGTELQARIKGSRLIVHAVGSSESLVETGQQLAWLGAALQPSPVKNGIAHCVPHVQECRPAHAGLSIEPSEQRYQDGVFCQLDFEVTVRESSTTRSEQSGLCWHDMFTNPILVSGFPIPSKPKSSLGLELPFDLLAGIVGASQAMGVQAMERLDGLLLWHFSFNKEGKRFSYLDVPLKNACDINVHQLNDVRHVVGWLRDSSYHAGAKDASYDLKGSGLPQPHAGALLEKLTINLGKIFTAGLTISLRVRRISPHLVRDAYEQKLMWIERQYVVLWDEETKRGWLVNGTSALLHLVRMSLKQYEEHSLSNGLLFNKDKMQNASEYEPASAAKVLGDQRNRNLEVWHGKSEQSKEEEGKHLAGQRSSTSRKSKKSTYLFENLVEQKLGVLELLIESQKELANPNGLNMKFRFRKHLEGWDITDLAAERDPEPRVATLKALGYGWVNLVNSISAITLFGRGFGNLITPSTTKKICPRWSHLPEGQYHLAVSMCDMDNIMRAFSRKNHGGIEVVPGLLWHSPTDSFVFCSCQKHRNPKTSPEPSFTHYNPVQGLLPKRLGAIPKSVEPGNPNNRGAVIFGHVVSWGSVTGVDKTETDPPEMPSPLPLSGPKQVAFRPDTSVRSSFVDHHSSKRFKSTYGDVSHSLPSVNNTMITEKEPWSRHVKASVAMSQFHMDDSDDEESNDNADNIRKMWWDISYPPRYVPPNQAAPKSLGINKHTRITPRDSACPPSEEDSHSNSASALERGLS